MSTEQEFKWQAKNPADFAKFKHALHNYDFKIDISPRLIVDSYFDDEQGTMSAQKAVLRLRSTDGVYEATFKTASKIQNGFVNRKEENTPIFAKSHTRALSQFKAILHKKYPQVGRPVQLFMIKNKRKVLNLESRSFTAEVCFDDCNILAGEKNIKMYEIEMEFKNGNPDEFKAFAAQITKQAGLKFAEISKVATAFKNL